MMHSHKNSPFCPLTPRTPEGPLSPGSPLAPACPGNPLSPEGPGGPGGPGRPGSPAAPDSGLLRLAANWASCSEKTKTQCANECEWSHATSAAHFYFISSIDFSDVLSNWNCPPLQTACCVLCL